MISCKLYKPIDKKAKTNCINCHQWIGKRCKNEAELLAREQKRYGSTDRMMRENRGIYLE